MTVRAGDASVLVRWTAPVNTGGLLVTSYTATASPGGATCTSSIGSPPAASCTVHVLTNSTPYTFTVTATTTGGTSLPSSASPAATPLAGTEGVNFVGTYGVVKWSSATVGATGTGAASWPNTIYNAALFSGYAAGTEFTATNVNGNISPPPGGCSSAWVWTQILCDPSPPSGAPIAAKDDPTYTYKLNANVGYTINTSSIATVQGFVVIDLGAVRSFTTLRIFQMFSDGKTTDVAMSVSSQTGTWPAYDDGTWTAVVPRSPVGAGSSITSGGLNYVTCPSVFDFGATSGRFIRLDFWNAGQFGSPNWVELTAAKLFFEKTVAPPGGTCPPEPPTSPAAIAGNTAATVTWTPPSGPITGYTLQKSTNGGSSWTSTTTSPATTDGSAISALVTGLTNGTTYVFRVLATNAVGNSPYSSATNSVTPTAALPNPPTSVVATAGDASAGVSWTASSSGDVTSYTVTGLPSGSCTATAPATSCTVTGLTNGQAYAFTVTATSGGGTSGASSASNSVTPASQSVPTKLAFTTQPGGGTSATPWTTQPVVTVQDAAGNTVAGSSAAVTLAITTPAGATLACTANPVNASIGVATFAGCRIDKTGTYALTASSTGLTSAVSSSFNITAGTAAFVTATGGGDQRSPVGLPFASPLQVTVTDSAGNPVSGATVTFGAPSSGPSAVLGNGGSATTDANGHASVTATANGLPGGPYTVTAAVGSLPAALFVLTNLLDPAAIPALDHFGLAALALLLAGAGTLATRNS